MREKETHMMVEKCQSAEFREKKAQAKALKHQCPEVMQRDRSSGQESDRNINVLSSESEKLKLRL